MRWLRGLFVILVILRYGGPQLALMALVILVMIVAVRVGQEAAPEPAAPKPRAPRPPTRLHAVPRKPR